MLKTTFLIWGLNFCDFMLELYLKKTLGNCLLFHQQCWCQGCSLAPWWPQRGAQGPSAWPWGRLLISDCSAKTNSWQSLCAFARPATSAQASPRGVGERSRTLRFGFSAPSRRQSRSRSAIYSVGGHWPVHSVPPAITQRSRCQFRQWIINLNLDVAIKCDFLIFYLKRLLLRSCRATLIINISDFNTKYHNC